MDVCYLMITPKYSNIIGSRWISLAKFEKAEFHSSALGRYSLCVHSLRKYFKTQLMALGVQSDYVDYMMGHTVDTYHDIQSKGIEFLRNVYASAGLSIKPHHAWLSASLE